MKGQAKKKGSIKRGQLDPASQEKRKENKAKEIPVLAKRQRKFLTQSLYIGSAYKIKKKKGLPFIYNQQRNVMSEQISL